MVTGIALVAVARALGCGVRAEGVVSRCRRHGDRSARQQALRKVWLQLRDRFPHPYTIDDAREFIRFARGDDPETAFAITVNDLPVGSIGVVLRDDVERCSAEIGYWLGELHWGRGIATHALAGFTRFAFTAYALERLYALPLASNRASCRVLEKAGYRLEGRMRRSAIKDGIVQDQLLYAILQGEAALGEAGLETAAR